jgi:hypothetical protein
VNDSKWEVNQLSGNDVYRLVECPLGYVIKREEEFLDQDRCIQCSEGSYSIIVAKSTAVACQPCPVGGECIGGDSVLAMEGFWRQDVGLENRSITTARIYKCSVGIEFALNFNFKQFL